MEEYQQYSLTREVRFDGGQTITVTVCLSGREKRTMGRQFP